MTKDKILQILQDEVTDFIAVLPNEFKQKLGKIFFTFDFNSRVFIDGKEILATFEPGFNCITFYLDGIQRTSRTRQDLKDIIKHEVGHHFNVPEWELPQQK